MGAEPIFEYKAETFPGYDAPIVRKAFDSNELECVPARFGLVPYWAKADQVAKLGRMAYNARTETVAEKPMFREAWKRRQFCLIPMEAFYEPNWESGKAVRWRIERADRQPFAVAGIWDSYNHGAGAIDSFSMLTVNADTHPLMNHFHRPGGEKRMVVIVDESDYPLWQNAGEQAARALIKTYPAELMTARPEPMPPRARKTEVA